VSGRPFQTPIGPEVYKSYYLRGNIIFCDICCFISWGWRMSSL